jgi:hypothetical protein
MTAVGAITMITMAVMFLIRYVMIGILLILLPLAILMWAIGSKEWGDWWNHFMKYTFFGPISAFFIYIALKSAGTFTALFAAKASSIEGDINNINGLVGNIGSEVMIVALLMGGLMAAEKMSIMGAKGGLAVATGAMKFVGKATAKGGPAPFRLFGAGLDLAANIAAKSGNKRIANWGAGYKLSKQKIEEGVIRAKQAVKKVGEFGGKSGISSFTSTFLKEVGTPLGYKGRHSDEEIKKKAVEAQDKAEERVKLLDKYKKAGMSETKIRDIFKAANNDNSRAKEILQNIDQLKQQFTDATYDEINDVLKQNLGNIKDAKTELGKSFTSLQQQGTAVKENTRFDTLTTKLTQLQNNLGAIRFSANPNPQQIQKLQQDIAKTQQDIKDITG